MRNSGFVTNVVDVWEKFQELTSTEMTKAIKRALNAAAANLQAQTKTNLSSAIKSDTGGHGKFSDRMIDAVRRNGAKGNYDEELYSVVHIFGSYASSSGTYRARFLEKGTQPRYAKTYHGQPLKKPKYTGEVRPKWFFKSANQQIESQLQNIYIEEINKTIQKLNNTKL